MKNDSQNQQDGIEQFRNESSFIFQLNIVSY